MSQQQAVSDLSRISTAWSLEEQVQYTAVNVPKCRLVRNARFRVVDNVCNRPMYNRRSLGCDIRADMAARLHFGHSDARSFPCELTIVLHRDRCCGTNQ